MVNIKILGDFDGNKHCNIDIYNGTKWTIKKIRMSIGEKEKNNKIAWQRIYQTSINIPPFSKGSSSVELIDNTTHKDSFLKNNRYADLMYEEFKSTPEVKIEEAFGYKAE